MTENCIPKLLNFKQKQCRVKTTRESLNEVNDDSELLKHIIIDDEVLVQGYDIETKTW